MSLKQPQQKSHQINKTIDEMLIGIEPMIWSILRDYHGISMQDRQDIKQETLVYIWEKVIPKYDISISKFSSFSYHCARNFITRCVNKISKQRQSEFLSSEQFHDSIYEYKNSVTRAEASSRIKQFCIFMEHNKNLVKPKEAKVVEMMLECPGITQREIADVMGYKHSSVISMMLLRMRKRIKKAKMLE